MAIAVKRSVKENDDGDESSVMRTVTRKKRSSSDMFKAIFRFFFSDLGMLVLNVVYAALGARMYMAFELPEEEMADQAMQDAEKALRNSENYIAESQYYNIHSKDINKRLNRTQFMITAEANIRNYINSLVDAYDIGYSGPGSTWDYAWTFPNTLLFTISIMTTVGYGHITPNSLMAQLVTMPYALFGMPLLMMFLTKIGGIMGDSLKYFYSRICCRWCRARRLVSERLPGENPKNSKKVSDDIVGEEDYMPTDMLEIPVVLLLLSIIMFLGVGSVLFTEWEQWNTVDSFYFSFITLSTIGFGDFYPVESFVNFDTMFGKFQTCVSVAYCCLGIAFLAMVVSLIQENLMLKADRIKKKVGMGKKVVIQIDEVVPRERLTRNSDGMFIGLVPDSEDKVEEIPQDAISRKTSVASLENPEEEAVEDIEQLEDVQDENGENPDEEDNPEEDEEGNNEEEEEEENEEEPHKEENDEEEE